MEEIERNIIFNADVNFNKDTVIFKSDNLESENQLVSRELDDIEKKPSRVPVYMHKEKLSPKNKNQRQENKKYDDEDEDGSLFFNPHKIGWANCNGKSPAHLKNMIDSYHDQEFLFK